jgi:hypothetical protein
MAGKPQLSPHSMEDIIAAEPHSGERGGRRISFTYCSFIGND